MKKNYKKHYKRRSWLSGMLIHLLFCLLLMLMGLSLFAQGRTVTGTITSSDENEPIPGATVLVKGTEQGTISDIEGNFKLEVQPEDAVLIISFVGYQTQEVEIGDKTSINVTLETDVTSLEEVVVVGYGTQRKKVVTAATTQVKGETLEKRNTTSALQALQGQAAGVSIRSSSGQPGEGLRVNIRGLGTTGNGGPLYIVDGVATGDISYLNNADIASVDVLKDAASAAIYGSRAANGVVLITTKKGSPGDPRISFDAYYGVQNRPKKIELLSARDYAIIMNEQHLNSSGSVDNLPFDINDLPSYTKEGPADTDWLDEMFVSNAVTQNYSIGVNGGSDQSIYAVSFSYTGQEGIVGGKDNSFYERYNGRINTEYNFFDGKLTLGENMTFSFTNRNGISVGGQYNNSLRGAFNVSPILPVYDDNEDFFNTADKDIVDQNGENYWNKTEANPYASMVLNNQNDRNERKLLGNVYGELELIKGLTLHGSLGFDIFSDEYRSFTPIYTLSIYSQSVRTSASQSMGRGTAFQFDGYANYNLELKEHSLDVMAGMSSRDFQGSYISGSNSELVFDDFNKAWLTNATNQEWNLLSLDGGPYDRDKLLSYFGRVRYNFRDRYMINATLRADGSSRFAEGNQWGYFPSVSGGWVLSEEGFMKGNPFINFLKIRASWGQNGNQNIPAFQYLAPISFSQATYNFGSEEAVNTPGAYPSQLSNPDLQWETSEQLNIGTDFTMLSNHLTVALDWYKKSTKDWLVQPPIPKTAGAEPPFINGGRIENKGFELELAYKNRFGDFNYSITANGNYNQNTVKEIPTADEIIHGATNTLYNNSPEFYRAATGHPIGFFWGYETDGIFQNTTEVNTHTSSEGTVIQPKANPGDMRYVDRNDDGILNDEDKVELGNPNPIVTAGFTIAAEYKALDFSLMTFGAFGHQIVQSYRNHSDKFSNYTTKILDRWTGQGTSTTIPRVTNSNINYVRFSDLFIEDGDFLRIGNITLGYDFAEHLKTKNIGQLRLYAAVNNLYTFTKYSGMDPDVGFGFDNGIQDKFSSGIDLGFYPNPRTMLIGLNVKF